MNASRPSYPIRPSYPLRASRAPLRVRPQLDPARVRLAISSLAISLLLAASMVWLILTYL